MHALDRITSRRLKDLGRKDLLQLLRKNRELYHEFVRRQVVHGHRVDLLTEAVLGYQLCEHHARILRHQYKHRRSMTLVWRGAGKTTVATIAWSIFQVILNRDRKILIASKTAENAKDFLKEIKRHFETNEKLIEIFGDFVGEDKWDGSAIEVKGRTAPAKEPTINTVGVEGAVASKHYDIINADDLVDEENSRTKHQRDKMLDWYYKVLLPTLNPPVSFDPFIGSENVIGTRYHYEDIYGHLQEPQPDGTGGEMKDSTLIIPIVSPQGAPTWPERYSVETIESLRSGGLIRFNCHAEDTEFLTQRGWLRFDDVNDGDRLMTLSDDGQMQLQVPTERIAQDVSGDLLRLKNRTIDALVTPNHRMLARPFFGGETSWRLISAAELREIRSSRTGRVELRLTGRWTGVRVDSIEVSDFARSDVGKGRPYIESGSISLPVDPFLRFLGYFVSEGSTSNDHRGGISFSQRRGAVADDMIASIREIGFEPYVNVNHDPYLHFGFAHVGLWAWLREHCGIGSANKRLPRFVMDLPPEQSWILLDALVDGDGSRNPRGSAGSFWYSTTSKRLNDDLHELCLRLGVVLSSRHVESKRSEWNDHWCSYGRPADRVSYDPGTIAPEPYHGRVVCFTTPNGTLVTRRNGRVLISGNSQYLCDCEAMKGSIFRYDDCQYVPDTAIPAGVRIYMGVDLAISEEEQADMFAIVVIGRDNAGAIFVLDYYEGHLRFPEQVEKIKHFATLHKPIRIGLEVNAYQKAMLHQLKKAAPELNVFPITTLKDKVTRAWNLAKHFENEKVFFRSMHSRLVEHLVLFPGYRYKDLFDALDLAVQVSELRQRKKRADEPGLM